MKKIFTVLAVVLFATSMFAQSYGILVNGKTYYAGQQVAEFDGFTQYLANVKVKNGDYVQLCDASHDYATWAVDLDQASVEGFTRNDNKYDVSVTGCFDFYIKLKYGQDQLYIGPGSVECGDGVEISGPIGPDPGQPSGDGNPRFMWKAELDGEWQEPSASTTFVNGTCNISFYTSAYLFLIYQVDGVAGVEYMCESYTTDTHARFVRGGNEKWGVPVGTTTLYLYDNGDGSVEVSNQIMPGKTPWSAGQGIENTEVTEKARKTIIDGQLRIIRGDKVFDVTGRQLEN